MYYVQFCGIYRRPLQEHVHSNGSISDVNKAKAIRDLSLLAEDNF